VSVNHAAMDDVTDNVIPLSRRELLWEELMNAAEWLDDLDSPMRAEGLAVPELTASERIRVARGLYRADADRTPAA
jgi:hypothetical protein